MNQDFQPKKILIPIDFSETSKIALDHAAHVCEKFGSSLHLLHVYTPVRSNVLPSLSATGYNPTDSEIKEIILEELDKIGKNFQEKHGVAYQLEVKEGKIARTITDTAKAVAAGMIVMGTHGASGFEEFFIGSNAYRTVTSSSVPVLTIQENAGPCGYDRIVVPIDSSAHTRDKISQAASIAKAFNSRVFIAGLITEDHEEEQKIFNLKIKQIKEYLDGRGILHESELVHGNDIAEMTLNYAEEKKANLLVIMTEQEASTGLFMGPYAQRVVNHSKVPVLSVTPIQVLQHFSQGQLAGDYKPFSL